MVYVLWLFHLPGIIGAAVYFFLLLLRILYGAGFGLTSTIFPTMASYTLPVHRLGKGMGYFGFSFSLAMAIGPVVGLWLLHEQGFRALIAVSFFTILTIFPLVLLIRVPTPQTVKHFFDKPKLFYPSMLCNGDDSREAA